MSSLCTGASQVSLYVYVIPFPVRIPVRLDWGLPTWPHFTLLTSLKCPCLNPVTSGAGQGLGLQHVIWADTTPLQKFIFLRPSFLPYLWNSDNNCSFLVWLACILSEILHEHSLVSSLMLRSAQQTHAPAPRADIHQMGEGAFFNSKKLFEVCAPSTQLKFSAIYLEHIGN